MGDVLNAANANVALAQDLVEAAQGRLSLAESNILALTNSPPGGLSPAPATISTTPLTNADTTFGFAALKTSSDADLALLKNQLNDALSALTVQIPAFNSLSDEYGDQLNSILTLDLDSMLAAYNPGPARAHLASMIAGVTPLIPNIIAAANPILVSQGAQDQIWNKSRDREVRENARGREILVGEFASRGFTVPAGPLYKQIENAERLVMQNNITLSRDVAIKAIDVAVDNAKVAAEFLLRANVAATSAYQQLYKAAIDGEIQIAQFVLDAAKALLLARKTVLEALDAVLGAKIKIALLPLDARVKAMDAYYGVVDTANKLLIALKEISLKTGTTYTSHERDNVERLFTFDRYNKEVESKQYGDRLRAREAIAAAYKDVIASAFSALNTLTNLSITAEGT